MTKIEDQFAALTGTLDSMSEKVGAMVPEVAKISGESSEVLAELKQWQQTGGLSAAMSQKLDAMVAKAQSVDSSLANLAASLQAVDDLVPDAAPSEPAPKPAPEPAPEPEPEPEPTPEPEPPVAGGEQSG